MDVSEKFSNEYNVEINFSFVGYNRISKIVNRTNADIVIAPKKYNLFGVNTVSTLEKSGLVSDCKPFVKRVPVIVVKKNSDINSLEDLNGKIVVLVDQNKYHTPGGCLGNDIVEKEKINAIIVYTSPKNLIEVVKEGKADATIMWLDTVNEGDDIRIIPIERYELQLYIAIVNKDEDIERYVNYLLNHKEDFGKYGWW